jgi:APA family basic amino acid/polyamine antiporter
MIAGKENGRLARSIGLFALIIYGMGDMIGAGIYGTIGVAAGKMGNAVWLAFLVSMIAALLTGLSYASLASRYPRAAGAAFVTQRAFDWRFLSYVVGLSVACSGLTSMAAGSRVFAANLQPIVGSPPLWCIFLAFIAALTLVNLCGIRECIWVNMVCTAIEVGGLLFVIAVSVPYFGRVDYLETPSAAGALSVPMIMSGAVLTFYAFVGFEDLLNLAEEVKDPQRTMPLGIVSALACVTVVYVLVSIAAVSVVSYTDLANPQMGAPLAQITKIASPWLPHQIYTGITLFAVANTALINFIMGSRLVYGMAKQGLLPAGLGAVNRSRHTPHAAILALAAVVSALAFSGDIAELASATSLLLLFVFALMNAALIVLKLRKSESKGRFEIPTFIPLLGSLVCAALIVSRLGTAAAGTRAPLIATFLLVIIAMLYFLMRPREVVVVSD